MGKAIEHPDRLTAAEIGRAIVPPRRKRAVMDWAERKSDPCPHVTGARKGSAVTKLFRLEEVVAWCQRNGIDVAVPMFPIAGATGQAVGEAPPAKAAAAGGGGGTRARVADGGGERPGSIAWMHNEMMVLAQELAAMRPAEGAGMLAYSQYMDAVRKASVEARQLENMRREVEDADAAKIDRGAALAVHVQLSAAFRSAMENVRLKLATAVREGLLRAGVGGAAGGVDGGLQAVVAEAAREVVEPELHALADEFERGAAALEGEAERKAAA